MSLSFTIGISSAASVLFTRTYHGQEKEPGGAYFAVLSQSMKRSSRESIQITVPVLNSQVQETWHFSHTLFTFQMKQALILIGVPEYVVHVEVFADQSRKQPTAVSHAVVGHIALEETGATIDVREQETVLEGLERHGYQPEFGC